MEYRATYSPEDNKLRLYTEGRLPTSIYERIKAAGFRWAPLQKLFVAPAWTPYREDLLIELAGHIQDEDTSLVDRADERADRFVEYSEKRKADADRAHTSASAIADIIPFGQPILVGHHSERRARRDAQRIENSLRRAVKLWDTSQYWQDRARGAIRNAKYKERPDVRHRRIKGIESDRRKQQTELDNHVSLIKAWRSNPVTWARARAIANISRFSSEYPLADFPRKLPVSQYEGRMSQWEALGDSEDLGIISPAQAMRQSIRNSVSAIRSARRWIAHYDNRLAYERAMLGESGGIVASKFDLQVGGQVLNHFGEWSTILKINKSNGEPTSVSTNKKSYPRIVPIDKIRDYRPPTAEQQDAAGKANKLPPLCNYPGEHFEYITQEQWDQQWKDRKGTRAIEATETTAAHRVRYGGFKKTDNSWMGYSRCLVFITDAKVKYPPKASGKQEPAPALPPPEKDLPTLERALAARAKARDAHSQPNKFDDMRETLNAGIQTVVAPQLFPTPKEIAAQLATLADIRSMDRILEPSAGTGSLIAAILKRDPCASITAIEVSPGLAEQLRGCYGLGNYNVTIQCRDFLECNGDIGTFDRIVMNPPFANGADIKHIEHARDKLRPGGKLVAICANGPRQQERIKPIATEWIALPPSSFATEGTNVSAAIAVISAEQTAPPDEQLF